MNVNLRKNHNHICNKCKHGYWFDDFQVCKLKKVHNPKIKKVVKACENYIRKTEKNENLESEE